MAETCRRDGSSVPGPAVFPSPPACPRVSVVIAVRNDAANLRTCLTRLRESNYADYEAVVVDDASTDETGRVAQELGARLVRMDRNAGPAAARNRGVEACRGDIVLFVDADVAPHPQTVRRVVEAFERDPQLSAVFGSYDATPTCPHLVSQFKNLAHHYLHQTSPAEADTFWTGCGAVRRQVFLDAGGFDTDYSRPSIEDMEFGARLRRTGARILLDRDIQATHAKRWTLMGLLKTDVLRRGVPWTRLMMREKRVPNTLNVSRSQRLCVLLALALTAAMLAGAWPTRGLSLLPALGLIVVAGADWWTGSEGRRRLVCGVATVAWTAGIAALALLRPWWGLAVGAPAAAVVLLNAGFYRFLSARRGVLFAAAALPLHVFYYLYSALALALGVGAHLAGADGGILRQYVALGAAEVLTKGLGFIATLVVIRHYGAAGFGRINLALTLVTYGLLLGACGTNVYGVRAVARRREVVGTMASTVLLIRLALAVPAYAALMAVCWLVPSMRGVALLVAVAGLQLVSGAFSLVWVAQALLRTRVLVLMGVLQQGLYLALVVTAATLGQGLWSVPLAMVVAELLTAGAVMFWLYRRCGGLRRPMPLEDSVRFLRDSAPIGLSWSLRSLALVSDVLLLGVMGVAGNPLGWYSGASRIYLLCTSVAGVYFVILLPRLSRGDRPVAAVRRQLIGSIALVVPLLAAGMAALALLSKQILRRLFGDPSFEAAAGALSLLMLAVVVGTVSNHFRHFLVARGRQRRELANSAGGAAAHVALKAALIPSLGILGAALGTLLGESVLCVIGGWAAWTLKDAPVASAQPSAEPGNAV